MAASTVLIQQVPFSFSRYRSLAYILMSRYLLFKFALPFSLARTYKRLVQPYRGFLRLCRYSKTFLRTFITHMHIQSLPRSRGAATIAENWSLTERRFRHLERTVLGRYLLSCHTVRNRVYSENLPSMSQIATFSVAFSSTYNNGSWLNIRARISFVFVCTIRSFVVKCSVFPSNLLSISMSCIDFNLQLVSIATEFPPVPDSLSTLLWQSRCGVVCSLCAI